jgi:hypothetical protein
MRRLSLQHAIEFAKKTHSAVPVGLRKDWTPRVYSKAIDDDVNWLCRTCRTCSKKRRCPTCKTMSSLTVTFPNCG